MCEIPGAGDELVHAAGPPGGRRAQGGGEALGNRLLTDEERGQIEARIVALEIEHQDLDDVIDRLVVDPTQDQLRMRRLKKRKLFLKDTIARLKDRLIPDIIA